MSKSKQKTHSEVQHLRGEIRNLKSLNRNLTKRLKQLEKREHFYENNFEDDPEEVEIVNTCPECKKGQIIEYDFKFLTLTKCNLCTYEQRKKKKTF